MEYIDDMTNILTKFKLINNNNLYKTDHRINIIFTDGSCLKNGKKNSSGGYASLFVNGPYKGNLIYGKVQDDVVKATNIRAEYFGIISSLEKLQSGLTDNWYAAIIYTDSEFWIKMLYEYMPKWNSAKFDTKANPDLTKPLWKLWKELQASNKEISLRNVFAHNKDKSATSTDPFKRFCHDNNAIVDNIAGIAGKLETYEPINIKLD